MITNGFSICNIFVLLNGKGKQVFRRAWKVRIHLSSARASLIGSKELVWFIETNKDALASLVYYGHKPSLSLWIMPLTNGLQSPAALAIPSSGSSSGFDGAEGAKIFAPKPQLTLHRIILRTVDLAWDRQQYIYSISSVFRINVSSRQNGGIISKPYQITYAPAHTSPRPSCLCPFYALMRYYSIIYSQLTVARFYRVAVIGELVLLIYIFCQYLRTVYLMTKIMCAIPYNFCGSNIFFKALLWELFI